MRTDDEFREKGWTRPTIRLDPVATAALETLTKRTGETASGLVRRLLLAEISSGYEKMTRASKKVAREP